MKISKNEVAMNLRKGTRVIIIPLALGLVFAIGCASKTGVTKTSNATPPPMPAKTTPAPTPTSPPEETITKPKSNEENVSGNEPIKPIVTEEIPQIGAAFFAFDKYDLTEEARGVLANNAAWLKKNPDIKIRVEGNCDERGTVEYNLALGEKRANAAKDYYISLGVSASRIQTISYGKEHPLDSGHNEESWAKNRRDDTVKVTP